MEINGLQLINISTIITYTVLGKIFLIIGPLFIIFGSMAAIIESSWLFCIKKSCFDLGMKQELLKNNPKIIYISLIVVMLGIGGCFIPQVKALNSYFINDTTTQYQYRISSFDETTYEQIINNYTIISYENNILILEGK